MVACRFGEGRRIWPLALLLYGVGDSVTTVLGLATPGAAEGSPVTLALLDAGGVPAFLAVKPGFVCAAYLAWAWLDTPGRRAIPLALVLVGSVVTAWNPRRSSCESVPARRTRRFGRQTHDSETDRPTRRGRF